MFLPQGLCTCRSLKLTSLSSLQAYFFCSFGSQLRSHLLLEVYPDHSIHSSPHPRLVTTALYSVEGVYDMRRNQGLNERRPHVHRLQII